MTAHLLRPKGGGLAQELLDMLLPDDAGGLAGADLVGEGNEFSGRVIGVCLVHVHSA